MTDVFSQRGHPVFRGIGALRRGTLKRKQGRNTDYCACPLGFRLSRSLQPFLYPFPSQAFCANDTCHVCRAKQVRLQLLNPNQDVFAFHKDGVRMTSCGAAAEPSSETWSLEIADDVGTPALLLPTTTFQRSVRSLHRPSLESCRAVENFATCLDDTFSDMIETPCEYSRRSRWTPIPANTCVNVKVGRLRSVRTGHGCPRCVTSVARHAMRGFVTLTNCGAKPMSERVTNLKSGLTSRYTLW